MGVYIKGMEMPTGERPVHIEIHRDGTVIQWKFGESDEIIGTAVEVPPHGRVIDADAIPYKKIMYDEETDEFYYGVTKPYIDRMPTIIEAEG